MTNHLQNRSGTYYFRRVVPGDIQHLILTRTGKPRTEWAWSLGVKNREEAKRKLPGCLSKTNAWIDQARKAAESVAREVRLQPSEEQLAASHAIADQMGRDSLDAAEFSARQTFEEEVSAEVDPHFAVTLELRAMKHKELRRLRDADEDRELVEQLSGESPFHPRLTCLNLRSC